MAKKKYDIHVNSNVIDEIEKLGIPYRKTDELGCDEVDYVFKANGKRGLIGILKTIVDNFDPRDIHIYDQDYYKRKFDDQKNLNEFR